MNIFAKADEKENQGQACWPIEDCIIARGDDGGYYIQDADETCLRPTARQIDEMIDQSHRRNNWHRK